MYTKFRRDANPILPVKNYLIDSANFHQQDNPIGISPISNLVVDIMGR